MTKTRSASDPFLLSKRRLLAPDSLGSPGRFFTDDHNLGGRSRRNKKIDGSPFSPAAVASLEKKPATISDLKEIASDRVESIRKILDLSHSEIIKDLESSKCRLSKRVKLQTQTCTQVMDEAERDCKSASNQINDDIEDIKACFAEFIAEAQATASRVCKVSLPELEQSFEKAIDGLRVRHNLA